MSADPLCDNDMTWYTIRTVYCWGQKSDGKNVFEERVVAFSGTSYEEALNKANQEATAYSTESRDIRSQGHCNAETKMRVALVNESIITPPAMPLRSPHGLTLRNHSINFS